MDLEQEKREIQENLRAIKHKILVFSGKGGVGKTTVAVNLASGLAVRGYKTAVLDIDIHGPNVEKMFQAESKASLKDNSIIPSRVNDNLEFLSLASFLEKDRAVIWRGPLKMKMIMQFLKDTKWGSLDFLIIDSPPGTGDEPLTAAQLIPDISGALVVTTPQEVALLDFERALSFARELKIEILGYVENMGKLVCPYCGREITIFKSDKIENIALQNEVNCLGKIPLEPSVAEFSDKGIPFISQKDNLAAQSMQGIVSNVLSKLKEERQEIKDGRS